MIEYNYKKIIFLGIDITNLDILNINYDPTKNPKYLTQMDAKCPLASTTLIFEHKGTLTLSGEKRDPRAKVRRNGRLWIHKETLILYQI